MRTELKGRDLLFKLKKKSNKSTVETKVDMIAFEKNDDYQLHYSLHKRKYEEDMIKRYNINKTKEAKFYD